VSPKPAPKPEMEKTTVRLPLALKRAAQVYALHAKVDFQDVLAEGLRLVLLKKGVRV
jgi:hypothetical protein